MARAAELALATTPYEMLLLDLGLPGKSGLDLLAQLRRAANRIPVLVITARDSVADRITGLDSGADDYLVKPFDLDELSAAHARGAAPSRRPRRPGDRAWRPAHESGNP
jgi:two-component system response regulator QseB